MEERIDPCGVRLDFEVSLCTQDFRLIDERERERRKKRKKERKGEGGGRERGRKEGRKIDDR